MDPQELFLSSCCKMRMSGHAKCCMLWFIESRVLNCTRAHSTKGSEIFWTVVCQVCLGKIRFCADSTHACMSLYCICACMAVCRSTHVGYICVDILQVLSLYRTVFFQRDSQSSGGKLQHCVPLFINFKGHEKHTWMWLMNEGEMKKDSRLKGTLQKVFCMGVMGVLAWCSVCIRGSVFHRWFTVCVS